MDKKLGRFIPWILAFIMVLSLVSVINVFTMGPQDSYQQAQAIVAQMTTREKLGQMIALDVRKWNGVSQTALNPECAKMIKDYSLGGICLFSDNIDTADSVVTLTDAIQHAAVDNSKFHIPMMVSIDQEGGYIVRLHAIGTTMPGNMAIGATGSESMAFLNGNTIGEELNSLGINLDFAPDLDVNLNPTNPVIGVRSFGSDPQLVSKLGVQYVLGLQTAGVAACGKHFPGHGNTGVDSHIALPSVPGTKSEMMSRDILPFKNAAKNGLDMIMTAHVIAEGLDNSTITGTKSNTTFITPATLSKPILTDLLRGELGFKGLIVTDAMNMAALNENFHPVDMVKLAILAGADMPLMPVMSQSDSDVTANVKPLFEGLEALARVDSILAARIDESATRIIKYKIDRGIYVPGNTPIKQPCFAGKTLVQKKEDAAKIMRSSANLEAENLIAEKSITLAKNDIIGGKAILPFTLKAGDSVYILAPVSDTYGKFLKKGVEDVVLASGMQLSDVIVTAEKYDAKAGAPTTAQKALIDNATYVIVASTMVDVNSLSKTVTGTDNSSYSVQFNDIMNYVVTRGYQAKTAAVSLSLPYELNVFDNISALVNVYCRQSSALIPDIPSYRAASKVIFGLVEPTGKYPVDVPSLLPGAIAPIRAVGDGLIYQTTRKID